MAYNFPVGYQPAQIVYQQPQQPAQQSNSSMIWVQGEAGVKGYLVAPNASVVLWDTESPTVYVKSADANGIPNIRVFDYVERTGAPKQTSDLLATKEDIDQIREELSSLESKIETFINKKEKEKK